LQRRIDAFLAKTPTALDSLLPQDQVVISGESHQHQEPDAEAVEDDGVDQDSSEYEEDEGDDKKDYVDGEDYDTGDDVDAEDHIESTPSTSGVPESIVLPLPSHLGINKDPDPTMAALSADELIIRQTQASESLQHLRLSLGMKSGIFRTMKANHKSQKTKTRGWKAINAASAAVEQHARSYRLAQHAIVQLTTNPSILSKFPLLETEDLGLNRDIVEENRVGQKSEHLSWVWRLDFGRDQDKDSWMDESK
jgi:hypothetical protein